MTASGSDDPRASRGTASEATDLSEATTSTGAGRGRITFWLILGASLVVAAIVGAYVDWLWWPVYKGLVLTLAAVAILVVAGILALAGRGNVRRGAMVGLAVGVGLLIGQTLGPTREPLILTDGGRMTLRLESPVVATATGPANCTNVVSETEYQVSGTPNLRLEEMNRVWDTVYITVGDRWEAIEEGPRKDGVRFSIWGTDLAIATDGAPSMAEMQAVESSIIDATFTNEGGSARFANLAPRAGPDLTAAPMDLAGTIEWTCGPVVLEQEN